MARNIIFNEKRCPICSKEFYPARGWVYKDDDGNIYCSYKCMRVKQKKDRAKKARKRKKVSQYTLNEEYIRDFDSVEHAADWVLGTYNGIAQACRDKTKYKGYLWRYKDDMS